MIICLYDKLFSRFIFLYFSHHRRRLRLTLDRPKGSRKRKSADDICSSPPCAKPIPIPSPTAASSCSVSPSKKPRWTTPVQQSRPTQQLGYFKEKRRKAKRRSGKRNLFPKKKEEAALEEEVKNIIPQLLQNLQDSRHLQDFVSLMRLIADNKFPLDNTAFTLLMDVARWYTLSSTRLMTYPDSSKLFWRVGYKLFHGGFIRFMSGGKSEGQLVEGADDEKDSFSNELKPDQSNINFSVPDLHVIRDFKACPSLQNTSSDLPPGVIAECIDMKAKRQENVSYILSVDGKKIAPGMTESCGDEDLFGHEKPKLEERKKALADDLNAIECLRQDNGTSHKRTYNVVRRLAFRVMELRLLRVKQAFALEKFMKWGGLEWRTSKYIVAISSTQARIHQVRPLFIVFTLVFYNQSL